MDDAKPLKDKVALVTGASAGIGRAIAKLLAHRGCRVAASARRLERLEALCEEVKRENAPGSVLPVRADLREERDILSMFDAVRAKHGGVDVLVNNAGLGHKAPLASGATEHFREMLDVNVLALAICTREAIADMKRRGDRGHIVHISSMAAHRVPPGSGMYSATKFAVRALAEALRAELKEMGSSIRVSQISPGFVETEFAEHYHKSIEARASTYGQYKVLEDVDIARSVQYVLESPEHMEVHDVLMRPREQSS